MMQHLLFPRAKMSADTKVIVAANSIGAGVGASGTSTRWPNVMMTKAPFAGKGATLVNRSVAGMSIVTNAGAGTLTASSATVDADIDPAKHNILFVHEFINELKANGFNAVSAHDAWVSYCQGRRAAAEAKGARLTIVTATTTPAGAAPAGEGQTWVNSRMSAIAQANVLMRRNFAAYADVLCDVAAYPPFAAMYAANLWTPEAFQASGLWARSDSTADDYTHFGNSGYLLLGTAEAHAAARVRP